MIKQPYITIFFILLLVVSILMLINGYSSWWWVGVMTGFYGFIIAILDYFGIDED
jgi:hypothetical protein